MIMSQLSRESSARSSWQDVLPVSNRYTFGIAGERFFREIKDHARILGTRCSNCGRTYVPAAAFCERCLSELREWVDVGKIGEIVTFTILHVQYDGSPREESEIVAFVRLGDGGLIHRLGEIAPEHVRIGMKVEALFKSPENRAGSITDISYFKPVA
jgi:uncharacterized OB-fold protein